MRSAWGQLGNKEKMKYVHRARNAMRDRNKHSVHASTSSTRDTGENKRSFHKHTSLAIMPILASEPLLRENQKIQ